MVPGKIQMNKLSQDNGQDNLKLAFAMAEEHLGIPTLLDPEEFSEGKKIDEKTVMNYVTMLVSAAKSTELQQQMAGKQREQDLKKTDEALRSAKSASEAKAVAEKAAEEARVAAEEAANEARQQEEMRLLIIQQKNDEIRQLKEELRLAHKQIESLTAQLRAAERKIAQQEESSEHLRQDGERLRQLLAAATDNYEESAKRVLELEATAAEVAEETKRKVDGLQEEIMSLKQDHKQQIAQMELQHAEEIRKLRADFNKKLDGLSAQQAQSDEEKAELQRRMEKEQKDALDAELAMKEAAKKTLRRSWARSRPKRGTS